MRAMWIICVFYLRLFNERRDHDPVIVECHKREAADTQDLYPHLRGQLRGGIKKMGAP